ncbi:DNA cytosine methyltransferase [Enterococcus sp. 669A]|uniref:DNA (cytosine-5-)-methyltransferase n=1 Tax=Candidatus Enterococcus moelleringii TaxID=2815325 RepID=A0ABS3LDV1_9ENTE|nr:DNA cytosine methyltransferase [Enterococcus sp. 669A]MBO1307812.1 DNA cytosine methyltransferase [Enterococcus sp. 669A]
MKQYTVVDLFCGAGGFSEGFHQAGFKILRAYDIWEPAIKTHNKNHFNYGKDIATKYDVYKLSTLPRDLFELEVPDSDVIIGSPPCVAFSNSNKSGKGNKELGIKLLKSFLRVVARKKFKENSILKYWMLENVKNIEKYIQDSYTMAELGLPGFDVLKVKKIGTGVYDLQDYGVPSSRKRYICGDFVKPEKCEITKSLGVVTESLGEPGTLDESLVRDPNFDIVLKRNQLTDHHYKKEIPEFEWQKAKRQKMDKGYMGVMSFPEKMERPARTIMATMSGSSRESMILDYSKDSDDRYRYPTIREVATCMSFPIDYRFYGDSDSVKYKLVGNAVPPLFSYSLAKAIAKQDQCYLPSEALLKSFAVEDGFVNLNGEIFPLKEEQTKKPNAKFKYHVPYLKIDAFRAELLNSFNNENVEWVAEIHKGQGKSAKVYKDFEFSLDFLSKFEFSIISEFIDKMSSQIESFERLQEIYIKTTQQRENECLIGPEELLEGLKHLINNNFDNHNDNVEILELNISIPQKILISHFILSELISVIGSCEKSKIMNL